MLRYEAPPLERLEDLVLRGLGPRRGSENFRRLGAKIRQTAEHHPKDLFLLAKLYWFIARNLGEASKPRLQDLQKELEKHRNTLLSNLDLQTKEMEALIKFLNLPDSDQDDADAWWRVETNVPEQISPGPLLFFSQFVKKPTRPRPVMQSYGTLSTEHPDSLRKKNPGMY
ncbi:hypothetical protein [Roseimicrobium sp. ORNL1]|uniref:hypothetical protein n=1 Tax=Roseimicrobium sp. ORNL1 TaxID=2711231 RepID=UPI0013E0EC6E|nr:hypothetical protein [Roseimicrobium sp. ORNL1]QIF01930.1 hypothetical protein G5S37_10445 [Roseimicrobium sp. ORNL1]